MAEDKRITVEMVRREVIESRLLVSLTEEETVAIVLTKDDCDFVIAALGRDLLNQPDGADKMIAGLKSLIDGLKQLREGAFGPK